MQITQKLCARRGLISNDETEDNIGSGVLSEIQKIEDQPPNLKGGVLRDY